VVVIEFCRLDVGVQMPVLSTYLGNVDPGETFWYFARRPRAGRPGRRATGGLGMADTSLVAPNLEAFFTDRLASIESPGQRQRC
jgi:hypothetical protein